MSDLMEDMYSKIQKESRRSILRHVKGMKSPHPKDIETGQTPSEVIYTEHKLRLLHYIPVREKLLPVPLLLIPPLINKYYILDLLPGNSFVEYMVHHGVDVYLVDWGIPGDEDKYLELDYYIDHYMPDVVHQVLDFSGAKEFSLLGYCIGGTFVLMYSALHKEFMKNLITIAAPVDFTDGGLFTAWTDKRYFDVDKIVDAYGNIPALFIKGAFNMLSPTSEVSKYVDVYTNVTKWSREYAEYFLAFDKWVNDPIPFPGGVAKRVVKECYQENKLIKGEMKIGGRKVDLKEITCPLLNIAAERDHIVPIESTRVLTEVVSSKDKTLMVIPSGHVSLVAGSKAREGLWPKLEHWLRVRSK